MTHPDQARVEGLIERLRHLVSLNEPRHGGPYAGAAAEACVQAMSKAADALSELLSLRASPSAGEAQCCMCGKKGLSTIEGDGGPECELDDGRWTCSQDCWERAVDPQPTEAGAVPVVRVDEMAGTIRDLISGLNTETLQVRVAPWMQACFGPEISNDRLERGDRLLEEVLELLQSGDYPPERVAALTDYTYSRPKGEPFQEAGAVMITLAAYCLAHDLDMHAAGETELARIWTKVEKIRAKQAAKPTGSALPVAASERVPGVIERAAAAAFRAAQTEYRAEYSHVSLLKTWQTTSETVRDGWRRIARAALEVATPEPETQPVEGWRETAFQLWKLLDDIDTLDDACKGDDAMLRKAAYAKQRERFKVLSEDDVAALYADFDRSSPPIQGNSK